MKKTVLSIILLLSLAFSFSSCTDSKYNSYDRTGERYDCYLPDFIEVCDYKNIEVPKLEYTVTNEDIERKIQRNVAAFSDDITNPDYPVDYGDIIDVVTKCYIDGEIYQNLTFKQGNDGYGKSLVLGSYELGIPAIDEAIRGMNHGESKTVTFNFPDPYYRNLPLSGKEATIEIALNNFYDTIYKEETDEFFYANFGYGVSEYQTVIRKQLQAEYDGYLKNYKSELVWNYIFDNSKLIKLPDEYQKIYDELLDNYRKAASEEDTDLRGYVKDKYGYETLDDFYEYLKTFTTDQCKREMILYYIARCENLKFDQKYYESELLSFAAEYEIKNIEDAESFVEYYCGLDNFKEQTRLNYVYEWLGSSAKVREDVTTYVNDLNKK